jgi:hypothetical protein
LHRRKHDGKTQFNGYKKHSATILPEKRLTVYAKKGSASQTQHEFRKVSPSFGAEEKIPENGVSNRIGARTDGVWKRRGECE